MKSDQKAKEYFDNNKVFPLVNSTSNKIYGVEAKTGIWNVTIDKLNGNISCTCKNIRTQFECSHIKAVRLYEANRTK